MTETNKGEEIQVLTKNKIKSFLFIFISWSLAVAQPVMNMLGKQPVFLVSHEIQGWLMVLSCLVLNFIPVFFMWGLILLVGIFSPQLKEWLARIIIIIMMAVFFLSFTQNFSYVIALLFAATFGGLVVFLLVRLEVFRTFILWFSSAGFFLIIQFLFISDSKQLLPSLKIKQGEERAKSEGPIYVFILDELPVISLLTDKNKIDQSKFPELSSFAKTSTWYPNTIAISSATDIALPAILSGKKPEKNLMVGTYEQYPKNIFSYFAPTHVVHSVENTTRMCPPSTCKLLIKDKYRLLLEDVTVSFLYRVFTHDKLYKLPPINDRWIGFMRELDSEKSSNHGFSERKTTFIDFVEKMDDYPENTLHFIHILLPHAPWRILPDLKLYGFYESEGTPGERKDNDPSAEYKHQWTTDKWATQLGWRRHLLQVGAVDKLLGEAFKKIKSKKEFEAATIIVTADHGSAFLPNLSRRFAHDKNIPDIAGIPLFIKFPYQGEAKVDFRKASNIDVLPTLLDEFLIKKDPDMLGISLKGIVKRNNYPIIYQERGLETKIPDNYKTLYQKHLNKKNKLFNKEGWDGVYDPKGTEGFLNKDLNILKVNKVHKNAIKLKNANLFYSIEESSEYLPVYYRLVVEKNLKEESEILVALNGKLVSHCYMFKHSKNDCAGLINPKSLLNTKTKNHYRFFLVLNKSEDYEVDELLIKNQIEAKIGKNNHNGLEYIDFTYKESQSINQNGANFGTAAIRLSNNDSTYEVSGWAGNPLTGEVAKKVFVFLEGDLLTTADLLMPKRYLLEAFGFESLINSGFEVTIPKNQISHEKGKFLRVFAEGWDGEFSELNYHDNLGKNEQTSLFNLKSNRVIPKNHHQLLRKSTDNMKMAEGTGILFDAFKSNNSRYTAGDWYKTRDHTRWIGSNASLALPNNRGIKTLQIEITAKPFLFKNKVKQQLLEIHIDGKKYKSIDFNKRKRVSFELSLGETTEEPVILTLKMPNAASPKTLNVNTDNRLLSLFLYKFIVRQKN